MVTIVTDCRPNEVGKVHAMFGKDYHSVFESLVFNTIKNEGTKHPLAMYRKSRPEMERDFHHKVRERLGGKGHTFLFCTMLEGTGGPVV